MKKTVVRLLSLLLIFSLGLGIMPLSLAETLPAESGNGITYQGINLEAGGQKPLTKAETDYYTEICDILRKNRNKKQMTVTEGDKTKVYTLSGQGDAAGLQEAVYQGKKAEASSLSSVSNISFSNRSAGQSVSDPDAGSRSSSATNAMNMLKDWKEKKNSPTPVTFTAQQGGASGQKADADPKVAVTDGAANKSVGTLVSNNNAAVSVKDASAASFRELYNSSVDGGPVTITAEELLQYIELGDEMAIEFAESLGFGRSEKKQKENLSAMVEEYKTHSDYKEPAFIINGVMIGLDKEIQEDTVNGGYRTDVSVNASASVTIVYDEKGEAKVMRRVPSDNPTDFLITLDVSGSMESNGRGTAMLSALEVLLDEILAKPENTATVIFWANNAAVMRLDIDQNQVIETFSGADGHTAQAIYASPLVNASGKQDSYGTTLGDYQTLNDRIINRIESLYGTGGSTAPSKGLNEAIRLLEQMDQTQRENRNLGVLLFTDGAADSGSEELKTVENETALVEKYGAQIVNVGIGDEKQVDQYRRYLDPNSDTYRGGENELLQDRILYYNIPKLTNQELAERVTEMFSTAFSEMTTEMVQLKSETVTTGVLAAVKTKVIETIPAGFQVMRSGRTYTVEGTDKNGNTIVSFELGDLMAGNGKTVSYFTVPQEGQKDIGVTAYTSAAGTSLYVEPVNRFHFRKYDSNGNVTKNDRGVEVIYKSSQKKYSFENNDKEKQKSKLEPFKKELKQNYKEDILITPEMMNGYTSNETSLLGYWKWNNSDDRTPINSDGDPASVLIQREGSGYKIPKLNERILGKVLLLEVWDKQEKNKLGEIEIGLSSQGIYDIIDDKGQHHNDEHINFLNEMVICENDSQRITFSYLSVDGEYAKPDIKVDTNDLDSRVATTQITYNKETGTLIVNVKGKKEGTTYISLKNNDGLKWIIPVIVKTSENMTQQTNVYMNDGEHYGGDQGHPEINNSLYPEFRKIIKNNNQYKKDMDTDEGLKKFLHELNTNGCGYVALANQVFEAYKDMPERFERTFGFPLRDSDGYYNFDLLVVDMYSFDPSWGLSSTTNPLAEAWSFLPIAEGFRQFENKYFLNKGITAKMGKIDKNSALEQLDKGESIGLRIDGIPYSYYNKYSYIPNTQFGAHYVTITGYNEEEQEFEISTYGRKGFIRESFLDSSADFWDIDIYPIN